MLIFFAVSPCRLLRRYESFGDKTSTYLPFSLFDLCSWEKIRGRFEWYGIKINLVVDQWEFIESGICLRVTHSIYRFCTRDEVHRSWIKLQRQGGSQRLACFRATSVCPLVIYKNEITILTRFFVCYFFHFPFNYSLLRCFQILVICASC